MFNERIERHELIKPVDALDLLKRAVLEGLLSFDKLPKAISLEGVLKRTNMDKNGVEHLKALSIYDSLTELLRLYEDTNVECGSSIIAGYRGNLVHGPICIGDTDSVDIFAPLQREEYNSPLGLTVYRDEQMIAAEHTHPSLRSFSLQDIYGAFQRTVAQEYVIKNNGVIDMAHITADTKLINEETFKKLVLLWSSYLNPNGSFKDGLSIEEYHEFLKRISQDVLKIGFY
jgi:hypothetical protein